MFALKFKPINECVYDSEEIKNALNKIAELLGRSSRTPLPQIQKHSRAVERSVVCLSCGRVASEFQNKIAIKNYIQTAKPFVS